MRCISKDLKLSLPLPDQVSVCVMAVGAIGNKCIVFSLNVAKVGGLQSQGVKGEVVVTLPRSLNNAGFEVLRLSRRVNNKAESIPSFEHASGNIHKMYG